MENLPLKTLVLTPLSEKELLEIKGGQADLIIIDDMIGL